MATDELRSGNADTIFDVIRWSNKPVNAVELYETTNPGGLMPTLVCAVTPSFGHRGFQRSVCSMIRFIFVYFNFACSGVIFRPPIK